MLLVLCDQNFNYYKVYYVYTESTTASERHRRGQTERSEDKKEDSQEDTVEINLCDDNLKELLIRMDKRMENYEKQQASITNKLDRLIGLTSSSDNVKTAVKEEMEDDFVVHSLQHTCNTTRH